MGGELPWLGRRRADGGEEAGEGLAVVRVEASDFFGLGVGGVEVDSVVAYDRHGGAVSVSLRCF